MQPFFLFLLTLRQPQPSPLFPYTTLFRSPSAPTCPRCAPSKAASSTAPPSTPIRRCPRSEEHTSELQSPYDLVCRLLLEKKKYIFFSATTAPAALVLHQPNLPRFLHPPCL